MVLGKYHAFNLRNKYPNLISKHNNYTQMHMENTS